MFVFVVYILCSFFCEARVFCEDTNASQWTPFGYSCPVLCATILNAIKRLQIMDYKKIIFQDLFIEPMNDINEVVYNIERSKKAKHERNDSLNFNFHVHNGNSFKSDIHNAFGSHYEMLKRNIKDNINYKRLINPKDKFKNDITKFVNKMASLIKMADSNVTLTRELFINNASRRYNLDDTFVSIMTNILNKYVSTSFKFTQEMTEVILNKVFVTEAQTRQYDVGQLLRYLRKTVRVQNNANKYTITLRARNCMSISVPGCFCRRGYVENSGQCVEPTKCLSDKSLLVYLDRINVL